MVADPLYDPLGTTPTPPRRKRPLGLAFGAVGGLLAIGIGAVMLGSPPVRDESVAVAPIERAPPPPVVAAIPAPAPASAPVVPTDTSGPVAQPNGDTVEIQNGVKVIRLGAASRKALIEVPQSDPVVSSVGAAAADATLLEPSRFGDLPRIGASGLRPSEAYAGRAPISFGAGTARVALLLDGLGQEPSVAATAASTMPAAIDLGFDGTSADLPAQVAGARAAGHEVILRLPAMPGAPRGNGRTTPPPAMLDDIHRAMGRFTGYAGVAIHASRAFLSGPDATDILRDIAARGLFLVSDAAGDAATLADAGPETGLRVIVADLVIDGTGSSETLEAGFARLEAIARAKGQAFAVLHGAGPDPASLASLVAALPAHGIIPVPVSALAQSAARTARRERPTP